MRHEAWGQNGRGLGTRGGVLRRARFPSLWLGWIILSLLLQVFVVQEVRAADTPASPWVESEQAKIRLISAVQGMGVEGRALGEIPLGLEIVLAPGWKTYWRSPGDAGFPLTAESSASTNLADLKILWPVPHRFQLFGLDTFGYGERVVLPLAAKPIATGRAMDVRLKVRYLVCAQICVPNDATLSLTVPAGPAMPSDQAAAINRYRAMVPGQGAEAGLFIDEVSFDRKNRLTIKAHSLGVAFEKPDLIVEAEAGLRFAAPEIVLDAARGSVVLRATAEAEPGAADKLRQGALQMTLVDGTRGLEMAIPPQMLAVRQALLDKALLAMIGIAFLGGVILNVMPCVLPVLALKLGSIVGAAGWVRRDVRRAFLMTACGVVASFLALAFTLAALKAAGHAVGWGMQFQQPLFLLLMMVVCLAFAANLWGLYTLPQPRFAGTLALAADARAAERPYMRAFLTGVFATLLATPCSAPFVGTAISFALARDTQEIVVIFLAMGLGLATPYILIAAIPGAVGWLPRPGRWFRWVKAALGSALALTAFWLAGILAVEWGLIAAVPLLPASLAPRTTEAGPIAWRGFDEAAIPQLVAQGKTVLIDVTADWCLTCKVNERLVLAQEPIVSWLKRPDVVALRADWTVPDSGIADYLSRHGRYGIPFNIVYGPKAKDGLVLPELLSASAVLDALTKATASNP